MDVTTVIIKVASEVVFKAVTDDIASIVLKKTNMAKVVFQERLDWLSEFRGLGVFCGECGETEGIFLKSIKREHQITHICLVGSGS